MHAHFDHGHFFVFINGFWCGLDDGFFPWDYLPYYPNDYYPYDYYAVVDPYDNNGPIITLPQLIVPRSRPSRRGLLNCAITPVQSMASSDRPHVTRWPSFKSLIS
jgi:hypothetical protein